MPTWSANAVTTVRRLMAFRLLESSSARANSVAIPTTLIIIVIGIRL